VCAAGKADPTQRRGCPGWQSHWTGADCVRHGCCSVTTPNPDPKHFPWCFSKPGAALHNDPGRMYVDQDYFIATSAGDPLTPFIDQGWWGSDPQCGTDHCCRKTGSRVVGTLPFPRNWTINMTSNNAAAVLMPDRQTLVQFQPLVRCAPGSPIFSLPPQQFMNWAGRQNLSILGDGIWGAHGGSHLSSIGGTVRKGELLPGAPPISHALKLMLWAEQYVRSAPSLRDKNTQHIGKSQPNCRTRRRGHSHIAVCRCCRVCSTGQATRACRAFAGRRSTVTAHTRARGARPAPARLTSTTARTST
jgi:hypothetical protein